MKNLSIVALFAIFILASCSKHIDSASSNNTPSFPVVTLTSDTFFTILQNGIIPSNITATAYDTFYKKSLDSVITIDYSAVDATTPGLYTITISATNQMGYIGYAYAYVAVVTNISSLFNFTGRYMQTTNGDTVFVTSKISKVSGSIIPGFYSTTNVAGVHSSYDSVSYIVPAFFAQISNTQIFLPSQITTLGSVKGINASCIVASADTAYQYQVINPNFGPAMRTFKRF